MKAAALALYVLSLLLWKYPPGRQPEVETRAAGVRRLEVVAAAQADSALAFGDQWPEGPTELARATVAFFGESMGWRLDVQTGKLRGPAGAVCFADLEPATLRRFATFPTEGLSNAEMTAQVVGLDYDSVRRCLEAGMAALVNARRYSDRKCRGIPPEQAAFAVYATGSKCRSPERPRWKLKEGQIEESRYALLVQFRARKRTIFPYWYHQVLNDG